VERFCLRHKSRIVGILSGFDRVLFKGYTGSLHHVGGMARFLSSQRVLLKDFGSYAAGLSARVKEHAQAMAEETGRPFLYVPSSRQSKEEVAREIAERDSITSGLVCILSCVEPCRSYTIQRNPVSRELDLRSTERKCLHLYFYFMDREFGLMHVRLQTWLPFTLQVCLNGREYLARAMTSAGVGHVQSDNCFTSIDDLPRAQGLLDRLTTRNWARTLDVFARRVNPWLTTSGGLRLHPYSWTLRQSEWATDVLFRDAESLAALYPSLVRHAIDHFQSEDVLRFLGRRHTAADVTSHYGRRGGLRVKHQVYENAIKMYDKRGSVLRIETTINNPRRFLIEREPGPDGRPRRLPMRKGLADLHQRVRLSQTANARYLDALAAVALPSPVAAVLDPLHTRVVDGRRSYRPLRPISPDDSALLAAIAAGPFLVDGFTNADIRRQLLSHSARQVSRQLALLRAHRLIAREPGRHRYQLTEAGRVVASASTLLRHASLAQLAA